LDNKRKLNLATKLLGKYFDISQDIQQVEALSKITAKNQTSNNNIVDDKIFTVLESKLNDILINASDGAPKTTDIISKINDILIGTQEGSLSEQDKINLHNLIQIYFAPQQLLNGTSLDENSKNPRPTINTILGLSNGQDSLLNSNPSNPTKLSPNLSVIVSNSMRMSLEQKNINPSVIFLNGMPNVELARATPYLNVEFFFPRPPTSNKDNRIQSLSLIKFLEGAKIIDNKSITSEKMLLDGLKVNASDIASNIKNESDSNNGYSLAGMEIFTAPQTLVNADTYQNYDSYSVNKEYDSIRANPILDKFRPLMTLNEVELTVVPTKGAMSYKSGAMKITLHDRSRLSEVAEFIRADVYGSNEILIEYGWSHPDGKQIINQNNPDNPYGLFLDSMKVKEKYNIINSSFSFKENGEVEITLKIAMRGASALDTELISATQENSSNPMKELEEIQKNIAELRDIVFNTNTEGIKMKEVRGIQILDAAQDINSVLNLGNDLKKSLIDVRKQLTQVSAGNSDLAASAKKLLTNINNIWETEKSIEKGKPKNNALANKIKKSIIDSISTKLKNLNEKTDPWLKDGQKAVSVIPTKTKGRLIDTKAWTQAAKKQQNKLGYTLMANGEASLANILLHFVGQPIACSKQYDEVQMIFYPFNANAGLANRINTANFIVDIPYFSNELARYRLENVSKSGNMSVGQFLKFLQNTILDDGAARSYGFYDKDNSFYKTVTKDGSITTEAKDDIPKLNDRINNLMKQYDCTEWAIPQIEFYLESLAEEQNLEDGISPTSTTAKTILRIHVYDRKAHSYNSIQSLLNAARNSELEQIRSINLNPKPDEQNGNMGVQTFRKQASSKVLQLASNNGFLEEIKDQKNSENRIYVIKGGSKELKRFIQSTMPYIIYGVAGTTITRANLSSMQDPKLNTVNLLRNHSKSDLEPNGENPGALPMRIIPTQLDISMLGCPFIDFAQQYFIDFQTGTTADNIYSVTGITHRISPGNFTTDIKFAPFDGYGKYQSTIDKIGESIAVLSNINVNK
jgi:hypothetical protein